MFFSFYEFLSIDFISVFISSLTINILVKNQASVKL